MQSKIRNKFYSWVLFLALSWLFSLIGIQLILHTDKILLPLIFCIFGLGFSIVSLVKRYIFLYFIWDNIFKRKNKHISPGKAVGFLFIPIYNIYWIFAFNIKLILHMRKLRSEKCGKYYIPGRTLISVYIVFSAASCILIFYFSFSQTIFVIIASAVFNIWYFYKLMRIAGKEESRNSEILRHEALTSQINVVVKSESIKKISKIRKNFNVGFWLFMSNVVLIFLERKCDISGLNFLILVLIISIVASTILIWIYEGKLLYKLCYEVTQDRSLSAQTVGRHYIPFYNFYWRFSALLVLQKNIVNQMNQVKCTKIVPSKFLALTYAILWCVGFCFILQSWYFIVPIYIIASVIKWMFYYQCLYAVMGIQSEKREFEQ
ncbi:MAG: hypothetical protein NTX05_05160 [Fusobacteria bacterium]|nr:hypothetical protein [Fusobacteriota bacterium]